MFKNAKFIVIGVITSIVFSSCSSTNPTEIIKQPTSENSKLKASTNVINPIIVKRKVDTTTKAS